MPDDLRHPRAEYSAIRGRAKGSGTPWDLLISREKSTSGGGGASRAGSRASPPFFSFSSFLFSSFLFFSVGDSPRLSLLSPSVSVCLRDILRCLRFCSRLYVLASSMASIHWSATGDVTSESASSRYSYSQARGTRVSGLQPCWWQISLRSRRLIVRLSDSRGSGWRHICISTANSAQQYCAPCCLLRNSRNGSVATWSGRRTNSATGYSPSSGGIGCQAIACNR